MPAKHQAETPNHPQRPAELWRQLRFHIAFASDGLVYPRRLASRGFQTPNYTHWLIRRGALNLAYANGWRRRVEAGSWLLLPPSQARDQAFEPGSEILSLHVFVGWPADRPLFELDAPLVRPAADWAALEHASRALIADVGLFRSEALSYPEHLHAEALRVAWLGVWYDTLRREGLPETSPRELDPRVAAAHRELELCAYLPEVPYERLCAVSGLGRVQLDRLFQEELGQTPRRLLDARCLRLVSDRLLTGRLSIKQIAFEAGFRSAAHFTTWFRRQVGLSPQAYRNRAG